MISYQNVHAKMPFYPSNCREDLLLLIFTRLVEPGTFHFFWFGIHTARFGWLIDFFLVASSGTVTVTLDSKNSFQPPSTALS